MLHAREGVVASDRGGVETTEVDVEPHGSMLLGSRDDVVGPLRVRRFEYSSI